MVKRAWLTVLFTISIAGAALVLVVAALYTYDTLSIAESAAGLVVLLAVAGYLWLYRNRARAGDVDQTTPVGIALGLLWLAEISINNVIAPPLPLRDDIDNAFWAVIGLSLLFAALGGAYQAGSVVRGIRAGTWIGLVSGLLACCMALAMIVFGMRFITHDPLNIAEWAERGPGAGATTMAAYFAFETLAGAFLHLLVLGVAMGSVLGAAGGVVGKAARTVSRLAAQARGA